MIVALLAYIIDIQRKYRAIENFHFVTKFAMQFLEKFQRPFCSIHLQT